MVSLCQWLHNHSEECWLDKCTEDKTHTLHKEDKLTKVITQQAGCLHSVVFNYLNSELTGRESCGWKRFTSSTENCSLNVEAEHQESRTNEC